MTIDVVLPADVLGERALNRAHAGDQGYIPSSKETLAARLRRAPDLYGRAVAADWGVVPLPSTDRGTYVDALAF